MGTPHEIEYTLQFNTTSIASKGTLPQEGAKRVLMMQPLLLSVAGFLNHIVNERRKRDYTGNAGLKLKGFVTVQYLHSHAQ